MTKHTLQVIKNLYIRKYKNHIIIVALRKKSAQSKNKKMATTRAVKDKQYKTLKMIRENEIT